MSSRRREANQSAQGHADAAAATAAEDGGAAGGYPFRDLVRLRHRLLQGDLRAVRRARREALAHAPQPSALFSFRRLVRHVPAGPPAPAPAPPPPPATISPATAGTTDLRMLSNSDAYAKMLTEQPL